MNDTVKIQAPATVANIGCGYDTIGFAVEGIYEEMEVSSRQDGKLVIEQIEGADLSLNPEENVATIAAKALLDQVGFKGGFSFRIKKLFKPGSGLGSSASSAAGAVFAVNELLPNKLPTEELLPFALHGEAYASKSHHADNVAPSLLGGCIGIRSYDPLDLFKIPIAEELNILIARPAVEVKTSMAKGIVPSEISLALARNQWGNLASLVHALHTKDWDRLNHSIEDFVAEPVRKSLIPMYDEMKIIAKKAGSVGFNISGSGPSVFMMFVDDNQLLKYQSEIEKMYQKEGIGCDFFRTKMSNEGCRIISQ